jgi:hypothetical protein
MSDFQDCIVSFIDLNDVGQILSEESRRGVQTMRSLHRLVAGYAHTLRGHEEICFWQDSVLLLGHVVATTESYQKLMSEVIRLKDRIQKLNPCHAVCVKGQSFPAPPVRSRPGKPKVIYLSASSLAFSNAFHVERELGSHEADWYIDSRIVKLCRFRAADLRKEVKLLPSNAKRKIHLYRGSPHAKDCCE